MDELPEIVELARSLGARAVWVALGTPEDDERARAVVESAGLHCVSGLDIVDEVRRVHGVS